MNIPYLLNNEKDKNYVGHFENEVILIFHPETGCI